MNYQDARLDDSSSTLRCPQCDEGYLHQRTVTIFNPAGDGKNTEVTCVQAHTDTSTVLITDETTSNPSRDRNGMLIEFECEHCSWDEGGEAVPDKLVLAVYQHKGVTFVQWVD